MIETGYEDEDDYEETMNLRDAVEKEDQDRWSTFMDGINGRLDRSFDNDEDEDPEPIPHYIRRKPKRFAE